MQAVNAAIERLDKRANDQRAIAFGLATDLQVIANALREIKAKLEGPPPRGVVAYGGEG